MQELSNELRNIFWDEGKIIIKNVLAPEPHLTEDCILLCKIYVNQTLSEVLQKIYGSVNDRIVRFERYGESLNAKILEALLSDYAEYLI